MPNIPTHILIFTKSFKRPLMLQNHHLSWTKYDSSTLISLSVQRKRFQFADNNLHSFFTTLTYICELFVGIYTPNMLAGSVS